MSENPPNGPQYGDGPEPEEPKYPQTPPPGGNYPPPGSYPPPGGSYPPPGGNYPPPGGNPPPGSYPPPPGNYPPPPGNYGASGFGNTGLPQTVGVGDAISFGWNKFKDNAGVWVGIVLIAAVIQIVLNFVFRGSDDSVVFSLWSVIGTLVTTIVGYLINAALIRGALHEVDGNKPAIGSFFQFANVASIIIASIIVGIAVTVGFVLLIIPGIIVTFLTWWTLQFVVDRNEDAISAIKSSFRAISSNAGPLFVLALALVGINILGVIPCGLGLLVTIPITIIASTYAYRIVLSNTAAA